MKYFDSLGVFPVILLKLTLNGFKCVYQYLDIYVYKCWLLTDGCVKWRAELKWNRNKIINFVLSDCLI